MMLVSFHDSTFARYIYSIFCSFNLVDKVVTKLVTDKVDTALLSIPQWSFQIVSYGCLLLIVSDIFPYQIIASHGSTDATPQQSGTH